MYHKHCTSRNSPNACALCASHRDSDTMGPRRRRLDTISQTEECPNSEWVASAAKLTPTTKEVVVVTVKSVPRWQSVRDSSVILEPVQDPPPCRDLIGVLARTLAPFVGTNSDPSPSDDIYTCLFRRQLVPSGKQLAVLGETPLRWTSLEAIYLAGADLVDLLVAGYTLDDIIQFPDCCLGRLLEMGLNMQLMLSHRVSFPLLQSIEIFSLSPDVVIHDLGMRVSMCSNEGLTPAVLHCMGMKASHLFQAQLLLSIHIWDNLEDPTDIKSQMGWSELHLLVLRCWREFLANKPLLKKDAQQINKYNVFTLQQLYLPPSFIAALQCLLPPIGTAPS